MSTFGLGIVHLQNHCGTEITKDNLHSGCRRDVQKSSCQSKSEPDYGYLWELKVFGKGEIQVSLLEGLKVRESR